MVPIELPSAHLHRPRLFWAFFIHSTVPLLPPLFAQASSLLSLTPHILLLLPLTLSLSIDYFAQQKSVAGRDFAGQTRTRRAPPPSFTSSASAALSLSLSFIIQWCMQLTSLPSNNTTRFFLLKCAASESGSRRRFLKCSGWSH